MAPPGLPRTRHRRQGIPTIALLGNGRAGKDTAGGWFGLFTDLRYGGSTSRVICPLIAQELGISVVEAWNTRHQNRQYWYTWANAYRKDDPSRIAKHCLADCDVVVGLRDIVELNACNAEKLFDLTVWIDNPRVPPDPTVTFTAHDCDIILENHGDLSQFYAKLTKLATYTGLSVHPWAASWTGPTLDEKGDWLGPLTLWRRDEAGNFQLGVPAHSTTPGLSDYYDVARSSPDYYCDGLTPEEL